MAPALQDVRKAKGLSQCQLAKSAAVPQATISELENGKREPRLGIARQLARALEASVDELFPDEMAGASGLSEPSRRGPRGGPARTVG